jgi:hypothetical protein
MYNIVVSTIQNITLSSWCFQVSTCRSISVLDIIYTKSEQIITNAYKRGEEANVSQAEVWQFLAEQIEQEGQTASRTEMKHDFQNQDTVREKHDVLLMVYGRNYLRHTWSNLKVACQHNQAGDMAMQGRREGRVQIVMFFGNIVCSAELSSTDFNCFLSVCQRFVQVTNRGRSFRPGCPLESNDFLVIKLGLLARGGVIENGVSPGAEETVPNDWNDSVPLGMGHINSLGYAVTTESAHDHSRLARNMQNMSVAGYNETLSCGERMDILEVVPVSDFNPDGAEGGGHQTVSGGHDHPSDTEQLAQIQQDNHCRNLELVRSAPQRGDPNRHVCKVDIERRAGILEDTHRRNLELASLAPQRGAVDETLQAKFFKSLGVHPLYPVSSDEGVGLDETSGARKKKRKKRKVERCCWNPDFAFRHHINMLTPGLCNPVSAALNFKPFRTEGHLLFQIWMMQVPCLADAQHQMVRKHSKQLTCHAGHGLAMDTSVWI